jgi:3-hydroxyisobutyrate dehydrogenase-like beta-hydroxyacid dehydrogenase
VSAPVGLFGLGLIGMALAGRLRSAGVEVIGHDPDPLRHAGLAALGGQVAEPADIWTAAEVVILAVYDADQVEVVLGSAPDKSRHCVIITSTCDPERVASLPGRSPPGIDLVEAPISGTSAEVAAGSAVFLLGGEESAVARARPLLSKLERTCHHIGALGQASRAKLAVNLILGLNRAALAEGLVFGETLGLAPDALLEVARDSAAASAVMATKGPRMVAGNFRAQGRIAQSAKDFGLILRLARAKGRDLPFARTYLHMMKDCIDAGEADLDNAAIIRAIQRAAARPSTMADEPSGSALRTSRINRQAP